MVKNRDLWIFHVFCKRYFCKDFSLTWRKSISYNRGVIYMKKIFLIWFFFVLVVFAKNGLFDFSHKVVGSNPTWFELILPSFFPRQSQIVKFIWGTKKLEKPEKIAFFEKIPSSRGGVIPHHTTPMCHTTDYTANHTTRCIKITL